MPSVIAVNVWRGFPFFVITFLAGLQTVPQELYDAAKVDGAGVWARFQHVSFPGILPIVAVTTLFSAILTFNDFSIIWILTQGGPGNATQRPGDADVQDRDPRPGAGQGRRGVGADVADPGAADRAADALREPARGDGVRVQALALRGFGWLLLAIVLLMALFPPYFMTITAFHPPNLSFSRTPTLFSTDLTLQSVHRPLREIPVRAVDGEHGDGVGGEHDPLRDRGHARRVQPVAAALSGPLDAVQLGLLRVPVPGDVALHSDLHRAQQPAHVELAAVAGRGVPDVFGALFASGC